MRISETYDAKELPIKALEGLTVLNALVNADKDAVLLKTNDGDYYLSWQGDCCAHCFIAHVSGANLLIGAKILSAENTQWTKAIRDEWGVTESMGTKFKTSKGYVDIETRVNHNGYYGGMINISKEGFIDAYSCYIEVKNVNLPLIDF